MLRHKVVHNAKQILHEEKIFITEKELERIRQLLNISNFSLYSEDVLKSMNAKEDDCQYLFAVTFDDGSTLTWDLCSGQTNYYDNVVFIHNGIEEDLDCCYELDDIEIECDNDIYIVRLEIHE